MHIENNIQKENQLFEFVKTFKLHLNFDKSALAVDINSRFNNYDRFEYNLRTVIKHLNDYAFGRAYYRDEKKFNVIGVMEEGVNKTNLHIHFLITKLEDTRRKPQELIACVRKEWAKIIQINNPNGSMIETEILTQRNAFDARFNYMVKQLTNQGIYQGRYLLL